MSARMKLMKELMKPRKKFKPQLYEASKKKRWDIYKGDKVQVIGNHPERGKQGIVEKVLTKQDRVVVEGVNIGPLTIKEDPEKGTPKSVKQVPRALHYSKVNLVDPVTGKPTRISKRILEDGTKVRVAKKSGAIIPKPDVVDMKPKSYIVTESDTLDADVWEVTYDKWGNS